MAYVCIVRKGPAPDGAWVEEVVCEFEVDADGLISVERGEDFVPDALVITDPKTGKDVSLGSDPMRWVELLPGAMDDGSCRTDVQGVAATRWGRPIANEALTPGLIPDPLAPWLDLVYFAGTLNGYDALGVETEGLQRFADETFERFRSGGALPDDLTHLRAALFAEQRRDYWSDAYTDPSPVMLAYVHTLVEHIRARVPPTNTP